MEKLKDYFTRYPHNNEVYENGGILFHTRGAADSYGKTVTKMYTRREVMTPAPATGDKTEAGNELKKVNENEKADIEKRLKETDIETLSYEDMKEFVSVLGIETPDKKKETLIQGLKSYQDNLNNVKSE